MASLGAKMTQEVMSKLVTEARALGKDASNQEGPEWALCLAKASLGHNGTDSQDLEFCQMSVAKMAAIVTTMVKTKSAVIVGIF